MAMPRTPRAARRQSRVFFAVALAVFGAQLLQDVDFAVPKTQVSHAQRTGTIIETESALPHFVDGARTPILEADRVRMRAAPVASLGHKVLHAMGAGCVASVIQAALSAVGEPIVNRVLVKRMKLMEAVKDVSPQMMLDFFKTTLATNFLKFPFFEAINAICAHLPISGHFRGFITGMIFTTATLPVTNYRYRKSMQLDVNWSNIYEAYFPTLIRDIAYGIVRNYSTMWLHSVKPQWAATSPQVLFIVVIIGCLGSAPFNEWRGFLLQSKGQELTFSEFFKPSNFVRSTSLGALKQGLALAAGYWCAPPATAFVKGLIASVRGF